MEDKLTLVTIGIAFPLRSCDFASIIVHTPTVAHGSVALFLFESAIFGALRNEHAHEPFLLHFLPNAHTGGYVVPVWCAIVGESGIEGSGGASGSGGV